MMMGLPVVRRRKCARSAGKCQGILLSRPMTWSSVMATIMAMRGRGGCSVMRTLALRLSVRYRVGRQVARSKGPVGYVTASNYRGEPRERIAVTGRVGRVAVMGLDRTSRYPTAYSAQF